MSFCLIASVVNHYCVFHSFNKNDNHFQYSTFIINVTIFRIICYLNYRFISHYFLNHIFIIIKIECFYIQRYLNLSHHQDTDTIN